MTTKQTTQTVTLADVEVGDIVFKFGTTLMNQPLTVIRVDRFNLGKPMTSLRYDGGGFVPARPDSTKVVLSVHRNELV